MINGYTVFDTHAHVGNARHTGRVQTAEQLLRAMDREGVDHALVIPFPVVDDYRAEHELIARATRSWPDRFLGAACIPPFIDEEEYREEVRRCREEYGFVALKLQPQYQAVNPLSSRSDFVFESALENGMVMVCHTGAGIPFALPSQFMMPARRFPELKIILSHCGGGGILSGEAIVAASFCPNIYLELSTLVPHQILEVVSYVPATRLMVGSDLLESMHSEVRKYFGIGIADGDLRAMLSETAFGVLGKPGGTAPTAKMSGNGRAVLEGSEA